MFAADFLADSTYFEGGLLAFCDGKDALDQALDVTGGMDVAGLLVSDVLGLSSAGCGDDGQADDAGFFY